MTTIFKTATDFRKSLEARLKGIAEKNEIDLQRTRRKIAFERLLARVFNSDLDAFVLKGGYAMELRLSSARATKDIDLTCLHRIQENTATIEETILIELQKLVKVDLNDYFTFQVGPMRMTLDSAPYGGARFSVSSFVDKRLFVKFQLDIEASLFCQKHAYSSSDIRSSSKRMEFSFHQSCQGVRNKIDNE